MKIKDQFDKVSKAYDSQRKKLIPCYDDFYGVSIENLELKNPQPKILDLGAGTGLFSQMVLAKFPDATMELADLSEKMLKIAAERFENNPNITIIQADYTKRSFPGDYDAIISSLSIHHLEDVDKIELYRKIFKWLKPGGIFINAEQVFGHTPYFENLYSIKWKAKVESTDLRKDEIKNAYERVKLDKRTPLNLQLNWLEQIGFKKVDCLYKYYDFVVIWAKR